MKDKEIRDMLATVESQLYYKEAHKDCKGCCATCRFAKGLDGDVAEALGIDRIKNAHTTYCIAP